MKINLNGKDYTIKTKVRFGLLRQFKQRKEDPEYLAEFTKAILSPTINDEELNALYDEDIYNIISLYSEAKKREQIEIKKKLSQ